MIYTFQIRYEKLKNTKGKLKNSTFFKYKLCFKIKKRSYGFLGLKFFFENQTSSILQDIFPSFQICYAIFKNSLAN